MQEGECENRCMSECVTEEVLNFIVGGLKERKQTKPAASISCAAGMSGLSMNFLTLTL